MAEMWEVSEGHLDPAQAIELALLLDLEARYENLRSARPLSPGMLSTAQDLHKKQQAYENFRAKLQMYNHQYTPLHVPEVMLNRPDRLGKWCRRMRNVYLRVEHDPQAHYPAQLLEKAYRCADWLATRLRKDRVSRSAPLGTIQGALQDLEALAQWCDGLATVWHADRQQ